MYFFLALTWLFVTNYSAGVIDRHAVSNESRFLHENTEY
ncbi:hypothetical protein DICVIV_11550 [Dictyocaulus viviparus]|uniref:Uncharacterized protein n=1 Tax=Dictyocaulus viviparus TaxID=29172 RepID=A0A0D8XCY7_DICVI|nr:hypothetical protein DICVIV_11550 [Dictyocaulus viviparus]